MSIPIPMDADLYDHIEVAEQNNDYEKLKTYFNYALDAEELNAYTNRYPDYILLHALIKYFDLENKYPEFLSNIFELRNVNPRDVHINSRNSETGTTALILAAIRGDLRLVTHLIHWKADPQARSNLHMTAFFYAICYSNVEVSQFLSVYVTKEELELENFHNDQTAREAIEELILDDPTEEKYRDLLNIIDTIELRHIMEDRIKEEAEENALVAALGY